VKTKLPNGEVVVTGSPKFATGRLPRPGYKPWGHFVTTGEWSSDENALYFPVRLKDGHLYIYGYFVEPDTSDANFHRANLVLKVLDGKDAAVRGGYYYNASVRPACISKVQFE
jgi:hypothetical protein